MTTASCGLHIWIFINRILCSWPAEASERKRWKRGQGKKWNNKKTYVTKEDPPGEEAGEEGRERQRRRQRRKEEEGAWERERERKSKFTRNSTATALALWPCAWHGMGWAAMGEHVAVSVGLSRVSETAPVLNRSPPSSSLPDVDSISAELAMAWQANPSSQNYVVDHLFQSPAPLWPHFWKDDILYLFKIQDENAFRSFITVK